MGVHCFFHEFEKKTDHLCWGGHDYCNTGDIDNDDNDDNMTITIVTIRIPSPYC